MHGAILAGKLHLVTAPQFAQGLNTVIHRRFVGRRGVFRAQHKIIGLPARSNAQPGAAIGQVVDHRPFLGHTGGMVQRCHTGPGAHAEIACDRRHRRPGHGRVGVGATKGMEVALRGPDCVKPIGIGKLGAFQQQVVFARAGAIVIAPVKQVEIHPPVRGRNGAIGQLQAAFIAGEHQLKTA